MNKIFFLKVLIGFMTLLIFLGMGGVVYGLLFYKKTPKLLPRPSAAETQDVWLGCGNGAQIADMTACGGRLCVRVSTNAEADAIAVIDPASKKVEAWIRVGTPPKKDDKK